jgi:tetratricopeptide (TPR) repeat protein
MQKADDFIIRTFYSTTDVTCIVPSCEIFNLIHQEALYSATSSVLLANFLWYHLGFAYASQANYHLASLCVHEALLNNEVSYEIYELRGFIHEKQGNYNEAIKDYEFSLTLHKNIRALQGLARCYFKHDSSSQSSLWLAQNYLQQALEIDINNCETNAMLADVYRRLDNEEGMRTYFDLALALEETDPIAAWPISAFTNKF